MAAKKTRRAAKAPTPRKPSARTRTIRAAAKKHPAPQAGVLVVNMIPKSLSGETNQDSEPNLAVNPANPLQMAASAFTPNPAGAGNAPIFVSTDGGNTWTLNAIVPSQVMTADITLRFSDTTNNLYASIIRTPLDPNAPRLNILRTKNFISPAAMSVVVDRKGQGVDQPYVQAATIANGPSAGHDAVFVGDNDFNQPNGRSATIDGSANAAAASNSFRATDIEARNPDPGGCDAPSIRPAIHPDGTIYGAFLHRLSVGGMDGSQRRYDVVVVRDDSWGNGAKPFQALTDPNDHLPGRRLVQNRLIPWLDPGLGQERTGSHLTIAVDPRNSATVFIAWADRVGAHDYTLHVRRSTDRGATWSPNDLLTITNALNPAVAVNSVGQIGFAFQQLTGTGAGQRWVTRLQRSNDGVNWTDLVLATTPASQPVAQGSPYLGDYMHLLAVGKDFYGVFSANNTPNMANFPNGVKYQRNANFNTHTLLDVDGTTPVEISIDPFFFKVSG